MLDHGCRPTNCYLVELEPRPQKNWELMQKIVKGQARDNKDVLHAQLGQERSRSDKR